MSAKAAHFKALGNESMKKQDYHSAVDCYKKGLAIEPKNPILNCNVSQAYLNLKNFIEAEKYAKEAIDLQTDYTKAYFRAAKAALGRHNVYDAMLYLARGVQNCCGENLEDLYALARELSGEFEKILRTHTGSVKKKTGKEDDDQLPKLDLSDGAEPKQLNGPEVQGTSNSLIKSKKNMDQEEEVKEAESKKAEQEAFRKRKEKDQEELKKKEAEQKERERREKEGKELEKKKRDEVVLKQKLKKQSDSSASLVAEVQSQLKEGSMALHKGLNRKAVECLKRVLDMIETRKSPQSLGLDTMDLIVIPFCLAHAYILSDEYKDVVKGIHILERLESEGKHSKFPAIFLLLGRAFMRLNRFQHAQQPLERGLSFLKRGTAFTRYSWPGTFDVIDLTDRNILKKALEKDLQESKIYHKPDCICYYENCLLISQHILPSNHIYFSDLDFVGYVSLKCQEQCFTYFHLSCWKEYKESLSEVVKLSEKEILGRNCITPDCLTSAGKPSVIIKVSIIGPDGEEKSSCKYNPIISVHTVPKEIKLSEKTPKKKQRRRRETDSKTIQFIEKKSKLEHKNKTEVLESHHTAAEIVATSNVDQLEENLRKLALARDNNFGYEDCSTDPRLSRALPKVINAGQNEEFIFSFFIEIFKKDGFMPVEKLKEHWEANKEILPTLQPALVTFTDLARFLLDSEIFALVHDTIGLAADLPDIYAIVQAQSDMPEFQKEKSWQPSVATAFEVNKSLTLASSQSGNHSTFVEDNSFKLEDNIQKLDLSNFDEDNNFKLENKIQHPQLRNIDVAINSKLEDKVQKPQLRNINEDNNSKLEDTVPKLQLKSSCASESSKSVMSCMDCHYETENFAFAPVNQIFGLEKIKTLDCRKEQSSFNADSKIFCLNSHVEECNVSDSKADFSSISINKKPFETIELPSPKNKQPDYQDADKLPLPNGQDQLKSLCNGGNEVPKAKLETIVSKKATWKPRAKLLVWATTTFPNETQARLWRALTIVRSQNNNTLSQLSFDAIGARVKAVLLNKDIGI